MTDLEIWITIVLLSVSTFLTRSTFWLFGHHVTIPKRVSEALRYAPACALAAILVPDFLTHRNQLDFSVTNPQLVAAVAASIFFLKTRSMMGTIVFGMAVLTVVRVWG